MSRQSPVHLVIALSFATGFESVPDHLRAQCETAENAKLTLPGQALEVPLGASVALQGDEALIGRSGQSDPFGIGSAHIFRFNGSSWVFFQNLTRFGGGSGEQYGHAVAMDADVAVIGASGESPNGAVYVFRKVGGVWTQEQRLTVSDTSSTFGVGRSVAVSGNVLIAGAPSSIAGSSITAGAAVVFRRTGSVWVEEQRLVASDPENLAVFGNSAAIDGTVLVIGADHDNAGAVDAGAAYIFRFNGSSWVQEQKLTATTAVPHASFGLGLSIDGDQIAIGGLVDDGVVAGSGSVYVFRYDGMAWLTEQKLAAEDGEWGDNFGRSVAIEGDLLVTGAPNANTNQTVENGSAYMFRRVAGIWVPEGKRVPSDGYSAKRFGESVSLSGNRAVVGSPQPYGVLCGAYVYDITVADCNGNASPDSADIASTLSDDCQPNCVPDECELLSASGDDCDANTVLDECDIAEGAAQDCNVNGDSDSCELAGGSATDCDADLIPDGCALKYFKLEPPELVSEDLYGDSVSISRGFAVIGAPTNDGAGENAGAAFVFRQEGGSWLYEAELGPVGVAPGDGFGGSVAIDGFLGGAVCGAPGADPQGLDGAGAVHVFRRSATQWMQEARLSADFPEAGANLGGAVAMYGDRIIAGAQFGFSVPPTGGGAAFVFRKEGDGWVQEAKLTAPFPESGDSFGGAVAISADRAAVGAVGDNHSSVTDAGSVFVFRREAQTWVLEQQLTDADPFNGEEFGRSVALFEQQLIIGIKNERHAGGLGAGSAAVFRRQGTNWASEAKLVAPDAARVDALGGAVAISGDVAVVGAANDDSAAGVDAGGAYVFRRHPTGWMVESKLTAFDAAAADHFGGSVAVDRGWIVVGATQSDQFRAGTGAAYLFRAVGGDCNANDISDRCDLQNCAGDPYCMDCNKNAVPDGCDIEGGRSADLNSDGIPDECQVPPIIQWNSDPLTSTRATRSLMINAVPTTATAETGTAAVRVELIDLQNPIPPNAPCCPAPDFSAYEAATCTTVGETSGCARWVGPPVTIFESQGNAGLGSFQAARLQCTPYYTDWTALGEVTIFGAEIMPSSTYELTAYSSSCKGVESSCTNISAPVQALTRRSGDVASVFNPPGTSPQPDAIDVVAMVNKFRNVTGAPSKRAAQIQSNLPELNADINALDIVTVVDAFRGLAYPFSGPCPCPSGVTCDATACTSPAQCSGGLCVKTCAGGANSGQPCITNNHCPSGTCGTGFCRDRCGRCRD